MQLTRRTLALGAATLFGTASAIELDVSNSSSILSAAKTIVDDIFTYYPINNTGAIPGLFQAPYYWWESGLAFDSLINYWALSGDESVVEIIQTGVLFQVGPNDNFMPPNQTKSLGSDDQATWALAAMTAAEYGLPEAASQNVSWVQLAKNVFDGQAARWDTTTCGGGLKWQIYSFNNGYNYKNSISNGDFLQLAARLYRYTGNQTYADWALKTLEWSTDIGLIDEDANVFDGTDDLTNCTQVDHIQWTSSVGAYLHGTAFMASIDRTKEWIGYTSAFVESSLAIFAEVGSNSSYSGIIYEVACVPQRNCNNDQKSFISIYARSLARTRDLAKAELAANLTSSIETTIKNSALAAAGACSGGPNSTQCGQNWTRKTFDGTVGLGQDLSALEIILANLPTKALRTAANSTVTTSPSGQGPTNSNGGAASTPTPATGAASTVAAGLPLALVLAAAGTLLLC